MEYHYSRPLVAGSYQTYGLCDGLSVRKHDSPELEITGTKEAQADWERLVSPLCQHEGGLGPRYGFMMVSMPECLPDRFRLVSYANEFAFLYDDIVDISAKDEVHAENDELLDALNQGSTGFIEDRASGKRQMLAKVLEDMLKIDGERALVAMREWGKFVETSSGREHHHDFASMREYLPYRCKDVGHRFWHALMIFGHGLTILNAEENVVANLVMPAVIAASLTNDLFSFEKEYHASKKAGKINFANGIWVLMKEHNIPVDQAKDRCRRLIKESVAKYATVLAESPFREDLSADAKRYVELIQYSVSGNIVWSSECPRYHKATQKGFFEVPQYPEEIFSEPGKLKRRRVDSLPPSPDPTASHTSSSNEASTRKKRRTAQDGGEVSSPTPGDTSSENEEFKILPLDPLDGSMLMVSLPSLSDHVAMEPFRYISNLPSKGVRDKAINALNFWLGVPLKELNIIKSVVNMLHNSSLLLDDLQDHSPLRRGKPSTHIIYGMEQTVNSATMLFVEAFIQLQKLNCPRILGVFTGDVRKLFIGQSYDILWTRELLCPTVTEYLQMVDGKTGGLFRLLTRLLGSRSPHQHDLQFDKLAFLFGRYFQIRDDYQNLTALDYTAQKGYCEDLDEGKYSLPLVHALHCTSHGLLLRGLLQRRKLEGKLTREQKDLVLDELRATGSLEYTVRTLRSLHAEITTEIQRLEGAFGKENFELRLLLNTLQV